MACRAALAHMRVGTVAPNLLCVDSSVDLATAAVLAGACALTGAGLVSGAGLVTHVSVIMTVQAVIQSSSSALPVMLGVEALVWMSRDLMNLAHAWSRRASCCVWSLLSCPTERRISASLEHRLRVQCASLQRSLRSSVGHSLHDDIAW